MEFEFEPKSQRYRWKDSKKYVSQRVVTSLREKAIAQSLKNARSLTKQMLDGDITVDTWEREFMSELKTRTIQLYQLGKPGILDITDRGKLGNQLRYQYDKLWGFRQAIVNDELSEKQIKYRAELYFNKTRWAYEEGRRQSHQINGYIWERRMRRATESCIECIRYAALGWRRIMTLPKIGELCSCQANCKCIFEYSSSATKPKQNTTLNLLNQIEWSKFNSNNLTAIMNKKNTTTQTQTLAPTDELNNDLQQLFGSSNPIIYQPTFQIYNAPKNDDEVVEKTKYNFGHPSQEQLALMNKYRPFGSKEYQADDVYTVVFKAANNLLWKSGEAWSRKALTEMSQQFLGKIFTLDHNKYNSEKIKGLIYDSEIKQSYEVKKSILENVDYDINLDIFNKYGFVELYLFTMFDTDADFIKDMYYRRSEGGVSTGSHVNANKMMCPHDGTYFGEGKYSYQCKMGHYLPNRFLIRYFYDDEELENLADYVIFDESTGAIELSAVVEGNIPDAGILTHV